MNQFAVESRESVSEAAAWMAYPWAEEAFCPEESTGVTVLVK